MDITLMIEGQEDVSWDEWVSLARASEEHGLQGLFRSDHYTSVQGYEDRGSLDAWATLAALGAITDRIRLGTLVSPVTFRHPSELAKVVTTADHVSGGRVELGIGAGWQEREHAAYGFPFPSVGERMAMLEEQVAIIHGQWTEDPFSYEGEHWSIDAVRALPRPVQSPRPTILIGGMAGPRSAALAARYADEYNTVFPSMDDVVQRRANVAAAWQEAGRDVDALRFSIMTGCVLGETSADVVDRARAIMDRSDAGDDVDGWIGRMRDGGWVIGTVDEAASHLASLADVGVTRMMLQHQTHGDLDMVALMGQLA